MAKTAFAIFCATDGSLTFYNRDVAAPAVGSTFEGKVVSNVYTGFDTASYTDYSSVPWYNERASIISVSFMPEFATIKPTSTAYWFQGENALTSFNGNNLNTSNVTDMSYMFRECSSILSIDLSNFDTSKVTNMSYMFYKCNNLTTLDICNFNTSNVTNMKYMFDECRSVTILDLSSFDTSNVTDMNCMFFSCYNLITIYVTDTWSTDSVTNGANVFNQCNKLVGAIKFSSSKVDVTYANYTTGYLTDKTIQMLIKNTTLYKLADKIRILNGSEEDMTPAEMIITLSNIRDAKEVEF